MEGWTDGRTDRQTECLLVCCNNVLRKTLCLQLGREGYKFGALGDVWVRARPEGRQQVRPQTLFQLKLLIRNVTLRFTF
jgi:hypothetical protein